MMILTLLTIGMKDLFQEICQWKRDWDEPLLDPFLLEARQRI